MRTFLTVISRSHRSFHAGHLAHVASLIIAWTLTTTSSCLGASEEDAASRPNVVIVLADDLGFSDIGSFGGEIETPNLDRLANQGIRFSQFYNTGRCWPTRASIMTGYYAQAVRRDQVPGIPSGGRGTRPNWAPLLSSALSEQGYRCYHSGKWHLDGMPLQNGFNASYYLKDQGRFFSPQVHYRNDTKLPAIPRGTDYYGTTAIGNAAVEDLQSHAAMHPESPFFLYLAFTAPHFPLHAPQELINNYRECYQQGWDAIRSQRWERIQQLGYIRGDLSSVQPNVGPPYAFPDAMTQLGPGELNRPAPWDTLTEEQQRFQSTKMAIHAAMIHALDREVGKVIAQIDAMDAMENTLILFLSDNGASAEIMVRSDGHDPEAPMGSADSYLCLGPGWSTVCNTPHRFHKTWVHEGGIATAAFAHWPQQIKQSGAWCHRPIHAIDIWPTVLEASRTEPSRKPGAATSNASSTPPPTNETVGPTRPGNSFLPALITPVHEVESESQEFYWHHEGNRAIRVGDWKLVAVNEGPWELYDLSKDRTETKNLAAEEPARVEQMAARWQQLHEQQIEWAMLGERAPTSR